MTMMTISTDCPASLAAFCSANGIEMADTGDSGEKRLFIYETNANRLAAIMATLAEFDRK